MALDSIDKKILRLIQEDSTLTTKELAVALGLSITPTFERVKKLNKTGFIRKEVALLDADKLNRGFVGFCFVTLKEHSDKCIQDFTSKIIQLEDVLECYHIAGPFDYLLKINTENIKSYQKILVERLSKINSVGKVESAFSMSVIKHTTAINL